MVARSYQMATSATDNQVTNEKPHWEVEYLDCGHFVSIPINIPGAQPHSVYEDERLQECCIKAMSKKLVHNG